MNDPNREALKIKLPEYGWFRFLNDPFWLRFILFALLWLWAVDILVIKFP